jgi:hypothetical protein
VNGNETKEMSLCVSHDPLLLRRVGNFQSISLSSENSRLNYVKNVHRDEMLAREFRNFLFFPACNQLSRIIIELILFVENSKMY